MVQRFCLVESRVISGSELPALELCYFVGIYSLSFVIVFPFMVSTAMTQMNNETYYGIYNALRQLITLQPGYSIPPLRTLLSQAVLFTKAAWVLGQEKTYRDNDRISVNDPVLAQALWESWLNNSFPGFKIRGKLQTGEILMVMIAIRLVVFESMSAHQLVGGETVVCDPRNALVAEVPPTKGTSELHVHGDKCMLHGVRNEFLVFENLYNRTHLSLIEHMNL
ncbi:hypothetical protein Sango_2628800 [Sesamum angolense]|uniref:Uncharacterized protein n=1 Tax=Sesamum angolense TaxID=2727404 RepID=A0AAE1W1K6_9LAMI|nr:hypothetical protein Sango_2628800 [Sesamum angolense]